MKRTLPLKPSKAESL